MRSCGGQGADPLVELDVRGLAGTAALAARAARAAHLALADPDVEHRAQRFRRWFLDHVLPVFDEVDVLVSAATPWPATRIGETETDLGGDTVIVARSLGFLTQPFSLIGLPALVAPTQGAGGLPMGIQLVAPPWREDLILRAAAQLERAGISHAPVAASFRQNGDAGT